MDADRPGGDRAQVLNALDGAELANMAALEQHELGFAGALLSGGSATVVNRVGEHAAAAVSVDLLRQSRSIAKALAEAVSRDPLHHLHLPRQRAPPCASGQRLNSVGRPYNSSSPTQARYQPFLTRVVHTFLFGHSCCPIETADAASGCLATRESHILRADLVIVPRIRARQI